MPAQIVIREGVNITPRCTRCSRPVAWTAKVWSFVGNADLLYHYGKLIGTDTRYLDANVWGCDHCKVAGTLPETAPARD